MTLTLKGSLAVSTLAMTMAFSTPSYSQDEFTLKVGGRVQIDFNDVNADNADLDVSATELRRARLNVSGNFGSNLKYKVEANTNSSEEVNLEDAFIEFAPGGSKFKIKAGQFKTPNSLDEQTSSRFISTLERAAFTDAFEFNRRVGISASTSGSTYTFTAGVFGTNLTDTNDGAEGYALAARGTFNPIKTGDTLVHLGASVRYRDQRGDDDLRFRQRAFAHIPSRIISTGRVADSDVFYGIEAAAIFQNFWVSGEYGATDANSTDPATNDASLNGLYGEVGVFFGGKKTYKSGKFNRPKVDNPVTDGGYGAVSLVARYDTIDLIDDSINGGDLDTFVLGADWWPTKQTRIGINYFNADANLGTSTSGLDSAFAAIVNDPAITSEDVSGFAARLQFDF